MTVHLYKLQDNDLCLDEVETLNSIVSLFCQQAAYWSHIVDTIGCIDVILGFAISANLSEGSTCRPFFVSAGLKNNSLGGRIEGSILSIKGLWHPYAVGGQGGVAVPNDVDLGNNGEHDCPRAMLLIGPNMGGKSTLLRATCLTVIMAQLGCYVPCESCALSPADVIFTHIGASDHIMSGESTFLIECMEAASVLRYATEDSLVVLDELGRGTYTFDGYAIAYAVKNRTARVEHEASTSKIGEDQLFYFQQRGIDPEKEVAAIINGFCRVVFNELPLEFAAEVNKLMSLKLEGSVG